MTHTNYVIAVLPGIVGGEVPPVNKFKYAKC